MLRGYVPRDGACGDGVLAIEETLSLCGLTGFFEEYEPVFLAGKNAYRIKKFKRGAKICGNISCAPG